MTFISEVFWTVPDDVLMDEIRVVDTQKNLKKGKNKLTTLSKLLKEASAI